MSSVGDVREVTPLRRALGLPLLTLYGLGTIVGAGIYVLVGKIAGHAGLFAPIAFLIAAAIALLTALSFAELSARFPRSAGEAVYVSEGFGRRYLALAVGLFVAVSGMVSAASLAVGFHGYLRLFIAAPAWLAIVVLVVALGALACWGIGESVRVAAAITVIEVGGLLFILGVAGAAFGELPERASELMPGLDLAAWTGITLGAFLAFYAFIGFEDMVNVAEEVVEPERNLPRALLAALVLALVLYLAVSLVAVLSLPLADLAASEAPLALLYRRETGGAPWLIAAISLVAVLNGALVQIIMASRVLYGLADQRWIPAGLAAVNPRTRTPVRATLLAAGVVLALALSFPLEALAQATSFVLLIVFAVVNLALWRVKRRTPHKPGRFSVPRPLPLAAAVTCAGLVVLRLVSWII